MSPEAQQVAIATHMRWENLYSEDHGSIGVIWLGRSPESKENDYLPDYLKDLNVMHSIEIELFGDTQKKFRRELIDICQTPEDAISASAEQRLEALLKALNLWDPTK